MKKFVLLFMVSLLVVSGSAQERKWEHSVNVGIGLALDNVEILTSTTQSLFALCAGYGLNYYLKENWSLHTGLTFRRSSGYGLQVGYLDIPLALQYHITADNSPWTFGVGPVFSLCAMNDEYDADHYVADGVDVVGQKMFKDFSLGLRPSIGYRLNRHWQIGVEGYIGLTNIYKEYGHSAGSEHLHCVVATVGYVF